MPVLMRSGGGVHLGWRTYGVRPISATFNNIRALQIAARNYQIVGASGGASS